MNHSSKLSSFCALSLIVLVVLACKFGSGDTAFSFPDDKKSYIGDWRGKHQNESMTLSIAADGTVNYERKQDSTGESTSKSNSRNISGGKITKFDGNDFEVKVLVVSTTFKVEKPPYQDGKRWRMVVDGMEVSRTDENTTELSIDIAEMRKDDGKGQMSNVVTDSFTQSDRKFHCYVTWDNPKAGNKIRFVYVAVDAGRAKNEKINETILTTENDLHDEGRNSLSVRRRLPKGDYKVDIYVNDQLERTVPFKIV